MSLLHPFSNSCQRLTYATFNPIFNSSLHLAMEPETAAIPPAQKRKPAETARKKNSDSNQIPVIQSWKPWRLSWVQRFTCWLNF